MTRFILILSISLLCGCVTQKRCLEKFPVVPMVIIETKDTVIYRDTVVYRYLPGQIIRVKIPVDTLIEVSDTSLVARTYLATARASIQERTLSLELEQHDSLFQFLLDSAIRESIDTITIREIIPVPEKVEPKWYGFFKAGFWILGVLVVLIIGLLILRK